MEPMLFIQYLREIRENRFGFCESNFLSAVRRHAADDWWSYNLLSIY